MGIAIELAGHAKDLGGGFTVRRLLPSARQRSVGPFVFFDHFGPATEKPGTAHDVRPHPHIGLATVTYLFEGAMMHRDSLGSVQEILPGAINWMTSGRGIVHSERKPDRLKADTCQRCVRRYRLSADAAEEVAQFVEIHVIHAPVGRQRVAPGRVRRPVMAGHTRLLKRPRKRSLRPDDVALPLVVALHLFLVDTRERAHLQVLAHGHASEDAASLG